MADSYIDHHETIAYGGFAVGQILTLVIGQDPELDASVHIVAKRLGNATDEMEATLKKANAVEIVTYTGQTDVVDQGRSVLRRLVKYAESREDGESIAKDLLNGDNLTTILRRRPVKLAAALQHAEKRIEKHTAALPEHASWTQQIKNARAALSTLNEGVRKARADRRAMTPEVAAGRERWMDRYAAAKLIVQGILRPLGKSHLMPEIFDDLAEQHRAVGVSDDEPPPPAAPDAMP